MSDIFDRVEGWRKLIAPEWRITLTLDPASSPEDFEDCRAAIKADDDYHHALLYISQRVIDDSSLEREVTIVHELLHLIMREVRRTLDLLDGQVHRDVDSLLTEHLEGAEEAAVERLARIIVHSWYSSSEDSYKLIYGTKKEADEQRSKEHGGHL